MRNPEVILNTLCSHSSDKGYRYERIYRILFNEEMFMLAYEKIKSKPGNMTPGTDGKTIDGTTLLRIGKLIGNLKNESYQPKPAKRVYIPKKNGKKRPLGIPSFEDKLVQEVVRMILEAIYEGHFEDTSHGFRPRRSCHTALTSIQKTFTGVKWFVEGDIKGFFDNIDHGTLIDILRLRIADERFLRLISKFLKAGYVEDWKYNRTYSGTPQGGIVSPILANIYLDQFDKYMRDYAQSFNKGTKRQMCKEYKCLNTRTVNLRKKWREETDKTEKSRLFENLKRMQKQMLATPSMDEMDENYRRLRYVRYADDFLVGVIGTKDDSEKIKSDIAKYMQEHLKLELSAEKTLITHAQKDAKFLGFNISVNSSKALKRNRKGILRRAFGSKVMLKLSSETVKEKLQTLGVVKFAEKDGKTVWKPKIRTALVGMQADKMLAKYNLEIRGFYNYYCIANNVAATCTNFGYIMRYSLYKTLARKYNSSLRKIIRKYTKDKVFSIPYRDSKGNEKRRILYHDGFKRKTVGFHETCDSILYTPFPKRSLAERLRKNVCEVCGEKGPLVMHHIRNLKSADKNTPWGRQMLLMHRKTIAVCEECFARIKNNEQ